MPARGMLPQDRAWHPQRPRHRGDDARPGQCRAAGRHGDRQGAAGQCAGLRRGSAWARVHRRVIIRASPGRAARVALGAHGWTRTSSTMCWRCCSAHSRHPGSEDPVQALPASAASRWRSWSAGDAERGRAAHADPGRRHERLRRAAGGPQIAPAVVDYALFCRSTDHRGLDVVLAGFESAALLALGLSRSTAPAPR